MKRLLQAYRCADTAAARRQLRRWYQSPLGKMVEQEELGLMAQVLPNLFGYHLLQAGAPMGVDMLASSRIVHRLILDDVPSEAGEGSAPLGRLVGRSDQLPLQSDSLDVLLLPHTLEFAEHPHEVLREAERTLIPEGHLVILVFNPLSLFGLRRLFTGWRDDPPWNGHFYSALRIRDWLALLGFDTVLVRNYFYRPPLQNPRLMRPLEPIERLARRLCSPLGGGYILVAKKRVATLTPIKPRWRSRRRLLPVGAAEPTARRDRI
ncbi:MAG: class I SAM-dependent methyltransferase [Gammaproteobacteria bacterium]|nr:class I SAM-dependent methyltransferase [Gammaproteobacteria bacterium]MCW8839930.1 class I SAM-dependent methyltransferase [Gammaproteobacteria bacterium]MCW8957987.1 class I SAM-dependent methyltransferase [Gammaproteobacteria bacterium]MCW8973166.1 class I SAM-dependent methyltransferase [Gammaproteobacteria bacterium]MCW8991914.1 class I SAM-dependent methyltransferase [Gammaproteobacteria bacterium]